MLSLGGAILVMLTAVSQSPYCATGMAHFKQRAYVQAQQSLWDCVLSGPLRPTEAFYLGLTYRELRNYDEGLKQAELGLADRPESVDLLYLAAFLHYRKNETKQSMLLLSKAYRIDPEDWRIHQLFALNYAVFDMPYSVELELEKAIHVNQTNAELYYQLGRLYFSQERFKESIEQSRHALTLTPDYPEAYDSIALAYEGMEEPKQAAENYRKAIELDRKYKVKDEWPLIDYGTLLLHEESPEVSLPYLLAALEINPCSPKANYQAGRATRALHRDQEAEKYFEKTISCDPAYSYAYYQLATLVLKRGDAQRANILMTKYKALMDQGKQQGTSTGYDSAHMAR